MLVDVVLVHLGLATALFFLLNWIGKHSYSIGYMEISMFLKAEEAPAFNFIFRVLGPVVFLFIVSAVLYGMQLDRYVDRIYLVSFYYVAIRLLFNIATNRARLLNWVRQGLYWTGILSLSYLSYEKVISTKTNILPDFSTIANELWIIILIFLFQTMNQLRFSDERTQRRKADYLKSRLRLFQSKYGEDVTAKVTNPKLRALVYAIIIYEDFNRPKLARALENWVFRVRNKPMSLGVMQVRTKEFITDAQSVSLGITKILLAYQHSMDRIEADLSATPPSRHYYSVEYLDSCIAHDILKDYNPDDTYISEVSTLAEILQSDLLKCEGFALAPQPIAAKLQAQLATG